MRKELLKFQSYLSQKVEKGLPLNSPLTKTHTQTNQCRLNLGFVSTLFSLPDYSYLRRWAQVLAAASGSMLSWIMQAAISTARPLSPMWASAHAWYMLPSHSTGPC